MKPHRRALVAGLMSAPVLTEARWAHAATAAQPYVWKTVPYGGGGYVDGFAYHPRQKDLLYARTDIGGLFRFDPAARRWTPLLDHLPREDADLMGVLAVALDPADADKVYALCGLYLGDWARKGAVLRSHDRGASWRKTELPFRVGGNADGRGAGERLAVDPAAPSVLFLGSNQDGLWTSQDGGERFERVAAWPGRAVNFVCFDPRSPALYVASADGKGGLFVSHDGGKSFAPVDGAPRQIPQRMAFGGDGELYVTFAQGRDNQAVVNPSNAESGSVWRRDSASGKWRDISPIRNDQGPRGGYSGVDVGPDGTVVVSTLDRWWPHDDIFVSRDKGGRWTALSNNVRFEASAYPWLETTNAERRVGSWLSDLKINPFNPDEMIYGHGAGLWVSRNLTDAGRGRPVVFDALMDDFEEGAVTALASPTGGATLLAAMGDTAGAAWDNLTVSPRNGLFRPNTESNWSVDFAGQKPGMIVRSSSKGPSYAFVSRDGAASWSPMPSTPYKPPAEGAPWRGPGVIAVSAKGSALLWAPEKSGGFHSLDGGKSWAPSAGWPEQQDQPLRPIADKVVDRVFYLHDRLGGKILVSVDGGATFAPIASGLPAVQSWDRAQLAIPSSRVRDLWLATPGGLWRSSRPEESFRPIRKVDAAWSVGFGASHVKDGPPTVFLHGQVEGRQGLWRSDDDGATWSRINDDAHQFGDIGAIAGDPLEYGTLYIAPHGRGVMVGRPPAS